MTVLPSTMLPAGVVAVRSKLKLPPLGDAEIALMMRDGLPKACHVLADYIVHSLENLHS